MIKKLSDICSFVSGHAWKASEFADEGIPIIRINNMNPNDTELVYWQGDYDKRYLINEGDLLVSLSGTIKTFRWNGPEALLNQRIVKVIANPDTNQDWVYFQISHVIEQIADKGKHAVIKNVSVNDLKNFEIDVPDYQTQNKIVAILDKASELVQKRMQSIDLLDRLIKSQFQYLFGDVIINPKDWPSLTIDEMCDVQSGLTLSQTKRKSYPLEIPYLRVANVFRGRIDLSELKIIRATQNEIVRTKIQKGDILIVEGHGNISEIGRAALWKFDDLEMVHQNHLIRLRINTPMVLPTFLEFLLNSQGGIFKMRSISNSTSGLNTISTGKVKSLELPIPPIELQRSFDSLVSGTYIQIEKLKSSLSQINLLLNSLLQRAFSGQLNLDVSVQLEALLEEIDLQKPENDLFSIITNEDYLSNLVNRLNNQKFDSQNLYNKAKHTAFQLLKTEEILTQEYDNVSKSLKLVVK